jgi:hypothetical protein
MLAGGETGKGRKNFPFKRENFSPKGHPLHSYMRAPE